MFPLTGQSNQLIGGFMLKSLAFFLQAAHMGELLVTHDCLIGLLGVATSIFDLRLLWTLDPRRFSDPGVFML